MKVVPCDDAGLAAAAGVLLKGGVAVIPTDTVYGLAAHPGFPAAVDRLYTIKARDLGKPIALLASDAAATPVAHPLTAKWPGALTIVFGGEGYRVPDHAWTRALIRRCGKISARIVRLEEMSDPVAAALRGDDGVLPVEIRQVVVVGGHRKTRGLQEQRVQVVDADAVDRAFGDVVVGPEDEGCSVQLP